MPWRLTRLTPTGRTSVEPRRSTSQVRLGDSKRKVLRGQLGRNKSCCGRKRTLINNYSGAGGGGSGSRLPLRSLASEQRQYLVEQSDDVRQRPAHVEQVGDGAEQRAEQSARRVCVDVEHD